VRAVTRLLRWAALLCIPWFLVSVFSDGIMVPLGPWTFVYDDLDVPLYALNAVALAALLLHWRTVLAAARELASPSPSPGALRVERRLLAALVGIGFLLRIARAHEYGLSLDEAQFLWVASAGSLGEVLRLTFANSPHPPGHFVLLHLMLQVSRDLLWVRLPSIVAGTFLIWASHRLARELFGRPAGLAMAVLVTFSPALLELSRACRNYVPGLAILVVALLLLVRVLRDSRRRDLAALAIAEIAAVLWAYAFVIPVAAANLTLLAALARRRASLRTWLVVSASRLPLVLLMVGLYAGHVTKLPARVVTFHEAIYRDRLGVDPGDPLRPLRDVWEYLALETAGPVFFWVALAGAALLLLRGEWLKLLLCAAPVALGYAAMAARKLPLGNSRHSVYLFPFLFGFLASHVTDMVSGYRAAARGRHRPPREGAAGGGRLAAAGALCALVGAVAYADLCMLEYDRDARFAYNERQRELLTYYRQADVERAFTILHERAGPRDMVMLSVQGMYAVRAHYGMAPILDPTPAQQRDRDLRWAFAPRGPLRLTVDGIPFFMAPDPGFMFAPTTLARAVTATREHFGLGPPPKVWALKTGWEHRLAPQFLARHPRVPFDADVDRETNGVLFAIDGAALARLAAPRP
jgi:hypothetical protein